MTCSLPRVVARAWMQLVITNEFSLPSAMGPVSRVLGDGINWANANPFSSAGCERERRRCPLDHRRPRVLAGTHATISPPGDWVGWERALHSTYAYRRSQYLLKLMRESNGHRHTANHPPV